MKTIFSFTFQLFALILLTSYSTSALAIDCKKAKSEIEKLICKPNNEDSGNSRSLVDLDNTFNTLYNKIIAGLDGEKKEEFKKSIKDLIKIRDACVNVYGLLKNKKTRKILQTEYNNEDTDQEYTNDTTGKNLFDKTEYQKGCLETFYNSIINSMKDLENFKIPSMQEYLDIFFAIRKFHNPEDRTGMSHEHWDSSKENYIRVYERFLFFKNHPFVIDRSSNWYYDPYPHNGGYVFNYTFNKDDKNIELVGRFVVYRDPHLHITSNITEINGSFYIPNDESFAIIFNNYYHSEPYSKPKPLQDYQKNDHKCLLGIMKKYSEKKINLELVDKYSPKREKIKYIAIKSKNSEAIRKEFHSKCNSFQTYKG